MKEKVLWYTAIGLFSIGFYLTAYPAFAGVSATEVTFPLGQVSLLLAVAAAWGDLRAQVKGHGERLTRVEKHVYKEND